MQLFKSDNHRELCSRYSQNMKWRKQDTELYLYYNYNCLKLYAYSQKLLCCCRLIVEHYFLKFLECSLWQCYSKVKDHISIVNIIGIHYETLGKKEQWRKNNPCPHHPKIDILFNILFFLLPCTGLYIITVSKRVIKIVVLVFLCNYGKIL